MHNNNHFIPDTNMFHNMIKDVDYLTPSDAQDIGRNQKGDQKKI